MTSWNSFRVFLAGIPGRDSSETLNTESCTPDHRKMQHKTQNVSFIRNVIELSIINTIFLLIISRFLKIPEADTYFWWKYYRVKFKYFSFHLSRSENSSHFSLCFSIYCQSCCTCMQASNICVEIQKMLPSVSKFKYKMIIHKNQTIIAVKGWIHMQLDVRPSCLVMSEVTGGITMHPKCSSNVVICKCCSSEHAENE